MLDRFFKKAKNGKRPIFIVEDNEVYAKSLKASIQSAFPEIDEINVFRTGELCLTELHRNPAVVIMDYFLNSKYPDADNGLDIISQIKSQKPNIHIIVLSVQDSPGVIMEAIREYDCGYVQKDQDSFQHVEKLLRNFLGKKSAATLPSRT